MENLTFCSARNCKDFAWCRGLCAKHYMQRYRREDFSPRYVIKGDKCLYENCVNEIVCRGLCWKHYRRALRSDYKRATYACLIFHALPHWLLYLQDHPMPKLTFDDLEKPKKVRPIPKPPYPGAKPCGIDGCDGYAVCRGICRRHYEHMRYHGLPLPQVVKPTQCAVEGCQGKRKAKNLCIKHYARFRRYGTTDFDGRSKRKSHGMSGTREYQSWTAMIQRCYNPKNKSYKNYGGRGIAVADRWRSFANFYADMGERPEGMSIHRIDVDGNYEPGNCKWATSREQAI